MEVKSYIDAKENLDKLMAQVCRRHTAVIIEKKGAKPVVMMPLDDYNFDRMQLLEASIEQMKRGEYEAHELIDAE